MKINVLSNNYQGDDMIDNMIATTAVPAFGNMRLDFDKMKGISCVGAVNYLQNFNIRFRATDDRKHVIQITKHLREADVSNASINYYDFW